MSQFQVTQDQIIPSTVFSTEFESDCVVSGYPDQFGNFDAYDSDGRECTFNLRIVSSIQSQAVAS